MEREGELRTLYGTIHDFAVDRDRGDTPLAERKVVTRALDSELMLLAQGLAQSTQRVTGYPYRKPIGLSPTGERLDGFLRPLGYTIDHTDSSRVYAYSTDLVPWYPGKNPSGKGDLRPTSDEVEQCWRFFEREVDLVSPRAIILLGGWAADRYLRRYGARPLDTGLAQAGGRRFESSVAGHRVTAVVAFHPSAVWGKFQAPGQESWDRAVDTLSQLLAT